MAIPPLVLRITADSSGVKKGVAETTAQVNGLKGAVQRNASLIQGALVGAVVAFGASAVKAFSESQAVMAQTEAVIKSTGGAAGVTADQVAEMATAFSKATTYSDDAVQSAQNLLLTFTGIGKDALPGATQAVLDMSTALGQDLKSSSIQVGKALNAPAKGLTALTRVGVTFTDEQAALITQLDKTGRSAEAQKIIIDELAREFGGSAAAATKTFAGRMAQLQNEFGEFQEDIGRQLVPLLEKLLPILVDVGRVLAGSIVDAFTKATDSIRPLLDGLDALGSILPDVGEEGAGGIDLLGGAFKALGGPVLDAASQIGAYQRSVDEATAKANEFKTESFNAWADQTKENFRGVVTEAWNRYIDKAGIARKTAHTFMHLTSREQRTWAADTIEGFDAVAAGFENLAERAKVSADQIIREFNRQARTVATYRDNLQEVAARDIPDALLQQLIDLGIGGAGILEQLANASDRKFARMVRSMSGARTQVTGLEDDLRNLRNEAQLPINVSVNMLVSGFERHSPGASHRAAGGPVTASRPYIVGERGPELFVPAASGQIVPNAGGVGGVTVNVHGDIYDAEGFEERVARAARRLALRGAAI